MDNRQLIQKFYDAFAAGDAETMVACYADNVVFTDPVFDKLKGTEAKNMWRMLLKNKGIQISVSNILADDKTGSADWVAEYVFSRTGRKVVNKVSAKFEFRDGLIVKHTDRFDIWKWSRQAMGLPGLLLGWTPFMQGKIRATAKGALAKFVA